MSDGSVFRMAAGC